MPLATGQTLTHYEILGPLGAGGMGEVYRARDTRLEREVAIKVLPQELSGRGQALARFEREAKTLAALNHPNVAQVFGFDRVDDTCFIAMELVEGEDLAERLRRGPLRLEEVVDVSRQIAAGLEAAHEAGVIHRDLKPANVRRTSAGDIKVLDFGLAKPVSTSREEASPSTATTQAGQLLGTPVYMAPEQARGATIDKRVDVWAFGCVLAECLTGRRAFAGESISEVLAAVLEREPDLAGLPASTPPRLRELLERCLRKDPRRRLRDIGDARLELEELEVADHGPGAHAATHPRAPRALLALALVAVVAAILGWTRSASSDATAGPPPRLYPITYGFEWEGMPSWSPNSESMAFTRMVNGGLDIYVKTVVGEQAYPLVSEPGDELTPRYSPEGKNVAYLSSGSAGAPLCVVRVDGAGSPRRVVDTNVPRLAINVLSRCLGDRPWLDERRLILSRALPTGQVAVFLLDLESEALEQLSSPGVGADDLSASLSHDGKRIVFERRVDGKGELWTMDRGGGAAELLLADDFDNKSPAWRTGGERVLFRGYRGDSFENLWELDLPTRSLRRVTNTTKSIWDFSVSNDDRIALQPFWHDTFLWSLNLETRLDRELTTHNGNNFGGRYSPDDAFIVYHSNRLGDTDIWRIDLATMAETNLTPRSGHDLFPAWSPDGNELVFFSNRDGVYNLFLMEADGGRQRKIVSDAVAVEGTNVLNTGLIARWSRDGERIAYIKAGEGGNSVWTVRRDGSDHRQLLERVYSFDWLDEERAVFSRHEGQGGDMVLYAIDFETTEQRELFRGPHMEIDAAPDGNAVAFCGGQGHLGMKPYLLRLVYDEEPRGLPTASEAAEPLYPLDASWHVHMGGWSGDSKELLFTWDRDYNDIFVLEEGG